MTNKGVLKAVLLLCVFASNSYANTVAGTSGPFSVDAVRVDRTGKGYVTFSSDLVGNPPSCGTRTKDMSFDVNTEGGKAVYALALAAYSANKRLYAIGTGTCLEYSTVESWSIGWILD